MMVGDQSSQHAANNWLDEIKDFYYDPRGDTAFSSYDKLLRKAKTLPGAEPNAVKPWLEQQACPKANAEKSLYCFQLLDVWKADLVDVRYLAKQNDCHRYLLTVIHVFTKCSHILPLKSKTATALSEAFETVLNDDKYMRPLKRRPVWVRTDKCKEFLGSSFQKLLRREGIQ